MSFGGDKEKEKRWVSFWAIDALGNLDVLVLVRFHLKVTQKQNLKKTIPIRSKSPQPGSLNETRVFPLPLLTYILGIGLSRSLRSRWKR